MSPKEKAQELYNKFYGVPLYIKNVKQCCYIAIDEILFALKYDMNDPTSASIRYWSEVKEEIGKIQWQNKGCTFSVNKN